MKWHLRSAVRHILLSAAFVTWLSGCHHEPDGGFERYVPSAEAVRTHLTVVLQAWVKGLPPSESGSKHPEVHVVDQTRRVDQRLVRFEILGEVPAENARAFAVRVAYDGTDEPETIRFVAVGVEPMWIFRQEDYENIWSHQDEPPADRAGGPAEKL